MPIIYGNSFKPGKIRHGEVKAKEKKTVEDTVFDTILRVLSAVAFIALSFIPVAGEIGEAAILGAEVGAEVAAETAAESAIEAAVTASEATDVVNSAEALASTARGIRLGDTIKGSIGLGVSEFAVNEGLDRIEGVDFDPVNSVLNFGLTMLPAFGAMKGRRLANIRFAQTVDRQIIEQQKLLKLATSVEQRSSVELKIRQLKNARLVRNKKLFTAPIDSLTAREARISALEIINEELRTTNKAYVKSVAKDLQTKLNSREIRLTKSEARQIVRSISKGMPSVVEGVTIKGIIESKIYRNTLSVLRKLDPSLAARQGLTAAARKLTSDEALFTWATKGGKTKEFGKWFKKVNLGYYKKFGKKLSAFWRKWGKKVYKHSRVRMIPVVSSWIEGYRLIDTPVPGEYIMVVIFKPSPGGRVPPPVLVNPVSIEYAEAFATGAEYEGSVGRFYINRIALARNGSGPALVGSLASILGPLSLGTLRDMLAAPAAFERIIRKVSKGDYFDTYFDQISETSNRLWSHKLGKIVAGRWGIATARGFQKTSKGHTTFTSAFDARHIIDEMGVVSLDKARAVQRKAGIQGRTAIIGAGRTKSQYQRTVKLTTFGYVKFDGKGGLKKGNGIF